MFIFIIDPSLIPLKYATTLFSSFYGESLQKETRSCERYTKFFTTYKLLSTQDLISTLEAQQQEKAALSSSAYLANQNRH